MEKSEFSTSLSHWIHAVMHKSMGGFIHFAKTQNLSLSQIGTLFHIEKMGRCGVSQIGDELGVSNAAASQMIERLVSQNLINRVEDPEDRRAKRLELTTQGKDLVQRSIQARQEWFAQLETQLSLQERQQARQVMDMLTEKITQMEAPRPC